MRAPRHVPLRPRPPIPDWGTQVTVVAHINGWPSCGKFTIGARLATPIEGAALGKFPAYTQSVLLPADVAVETGMLRLSPLRGSRAQGKAFASSIHPGLKLAPPPARQVRSGQLCGLTPGAKLAPGDVA